MERNLVMESTMERFAVCAPLVDGYVPCSCRDCMEIAIGKRGRALCHMCEDAGCVPYVVDEEGEVVDGDCECSVVPDPEDMEYVNLRRTDR